MILMRHPNLVAAYGASLIDPGGSNQIEDLSGNGHHMPYLEGTQPTPTGSGDGLLFYSDTTMGIRWENGTWLSKPHLWAGVTVMGEFTPGQNSYDKWFCFQEGIWTGGRAQPCYIVNGFTWSGNRYLYTNYDDWNPDVPLYGTNLHTPLAGRHWECIRADHTVGAMHSKTCCGDQHLITSNDIVRTSTPGSRASALCVPSGAPSDEEWMITNREYNDGLILHNLLLFDCCLTDSDLQRVKMGFAPIGNYPSPKPPNS